MEPSTFHTVEVSPISSSLTNPVGEREFPHAINQTAKEMLRGNLVVGKVLGARLQGIREPVSIPSQRSHAGLGFNGELKRKKPVKKIQGVPVFLKFVK